MTKCSNKLKKPYFWPILGPFFQFFGKKFFLPENPALSRPTAHDILPPCQNLGKINNTNSRKHPDQRKGGRTEGWTEAQLDRRALIYRTLKATIGGPIIGLQKKILSFIHFANMIVFHCFNIISCLLSFTWSSIYFQLLQLIKF